jgi:hypothetical protein
MLINTAQKAYDNPPVCDIKGDSWSVDASVTQVTVNATVVVTSNHACWRGSYSNPEGHVIMRVGLIPARNGTLTPRGSNGWTYKSRPDYRGPDSFTVIYSENKGNNKLVRGTIIFSVTVK